MLVKCNLRYFHYYYGINKHNTTKTVPFLVQLSAVQIFHHILVISLLNGRETFSAVTGDIPGIFSKEME